MSPGPSPALYFVFSSLANRSSAAAVASSGAAALCLQGLDASGPGRSAEAGEARPGSRPARDSPVSRRTCTCESTGEVCERWR